MPIFRRYLLICCCLATLPGHAQLFSGTNGGVNVAVVSAMGNRFQRLGFTIQAYRVFVYVQTNAEVRIYYNFKNLGPTKKYWELVTSAGVAVGYGEQRTEHNPFTGVVANQTAYTNSIAYAYNCYFNKIKTTQQTGILAFQFNRISITSENDIFARPTLDRFRTGAFLLQYQYKDQLQYAINCTMWTGQMGNKVTNDKGFPYIGYMDTTNGVYTQYSLGLLSAQIKAAPGSGQTLQANVGVDAEQVRNFVQNRMIHDMPFVPSQWQRTKNCHIPMLDTAGNQYLYKPDQQIKQARFYWNVVTGASTFY